jgi:hypothetical protein
MSDDINYVDGAEVCRLAITSLSGIEALSGVQYEEVAFFTAAQTYCELQVRLRAINARLAELDANQTTNLEETHATLPQPFPRQGFRTQPKSERALARTRRPQTRYSAQFDLLESSAADVQTEQAFITMRANAARKEAECALRRWTMLCFWECCEGGECCHVQEATRSLHIFREADHVALEGGAEGHEQESLPEALTRYREEMATHLARAMKASTHFANLMCERAGEFYRDFIAVLIETFERVVDLVEEARLNPPRPMFNS